MPTGVYIRKNLKVYPTECENCSSILGHRSITKFCRSCAQKRNPTRYWLGKKRPDFAKWQIGRKFTKEHIENLRRSHIGNESYWKGKKRPNMTGELHHNWKGGKETEKARNVTHENNRRARKMGNGGVHTLEQWNSLKKLYNYMCLCCKQQEPFIKLTEDHIIPLSMGGRNDIENIQPLCHPCNSRKSTKSVDYILGVTYLKQNA